MGKYRNIKFNVSNRTEWLLAIQHAENNGFVVLGCMLDRLRTYQGGRGVVNVRLHVNSVGLNDKSHELVADNQLGVTTLDAFKHAVNCFCHDGYLNDTNLEL